MFLYTVTMNRKTVTTRRVVGRENHGHGGVTLLAGFVDPASVARLDAKFRAAFSARGRATRVRRNLKRLNEIFSRAPKLSHESIDRIAGAPYFPDSE
jgi:hypothetical protein